MKLSYNWLKKFLPNLKITPEKLAEILNLHVASVENVKKIGKNLNGVVVAEIIGIRRHPNADKLQLVEVNTGKKKFEVVCGAFNIKIGQKVPFALPGAILGDGVKLESRIIRGIRSTGMLCAEDELSIGEDHTGIYILPSNLELNLPVKEILDLDDTILEIENKSITHRPDLFSHIGFAREIGALTDSKFKYSFANSSFKDLQTKKQKTKKGEKQIKILVKDKKLCPRYTALVVKGIKIKPSPLWMQNRLRNLGIKPINNLVDITNYVMVEMGQPLHAFDFNKLEGSKIIIRRAKNKEKFLALNDQQLELTTDDLIIADSKKPIALAGIIGGKLSEITENTNMAVIESANFAFASIHKTSWRLGIRTDAALRFEKGLGLKCPELGLRRAYELIKKIIKPSQIDEIFDLKSESTQKELNHIKTIIFEFSHLDRLVGQEIPHHKVINILENLGFRISKIGKDKIRIQIPKWRQDIDLEEDIIEEIVRIYGTNKIRVSPVLAELKANKIQKKFVLEKKLRNILVGLGFDEVYNYSFGPKKEHSLEIANPMNPNQQFLRTDLFSGLLKNAEKNAKKFSKFKIFEIGKIYWQEKNNVQEKKKIAGLIYEKNKDIYLSIKGVVETILERMGIENKKIKSLHSLEQRNILILVGKESIGSFRQINENIAVFELDIEKMVEFSREKIYQPISPYPSVKRDLAFLIDKKDAWGEISYAVKNVNPLITKVELFDVFENKKFKGKRNLAFHIVYQSLKRTLNAEEVDKIQKQIIRMLQEKFNAQLRNF